PDEPLFLYIDAIEKGRAGEALRRLGDFLTHGHPLQVIGALDNDLRRRVLAAAAPDLETLAQWIGAKPSDRRAERVWRIRERVAESALRRARGAMLRAVRGLKSQPEDSHGVTMERRVGGLCRWYWERSVRPQGAETGGEAGLLARRRVGLEDALRNGLV